MSLLSYYKMIELGGAVEDRGRETIHRNEGGSETLNQESVLKGVEHLDESGGTREVKVTLSVGG